MGDGHVGAQIDVSVIHKLKNPFGEFGSLVMSSVSTISCKEECNRLVSITYVAELDKAIAQSP